MKYGSIFAAAILCSSLAYADGETDKAIEEVQQMMQKPDFKNQASKNSKEAADVANHVTNISGGGSNEQDIYKMAAEVLGNMKGKSPEEMAKILEDAKKDPEGFVNTWSPEQKAKLKEISERMPAHNQGKP